VLFAVVPAVFIATAVFMTALFPITEKKAREVRALLNARKQAAQAEPAQV
jgi:GPH family glycoside/pentoside/hexuronide:cation symporter